MSKPKTLKHARAVDIEWETDGQQVSLPSIVSLPEHVEEEDVADYLSDTFGWLVNSYRYDRRTA